MWDLSYALWTKLQMQSTRLNSTSCKSNWSGKRSKMSSSADFARSCDYHALLSFCGNNNHETHSLMRKSCFPKLRIRTKNLVWLCSDAPGLKNRHRLRCFAAEAPRCSGTWPPPMKAQARKNSLMQKCNT